MYNYIGALIIVIGPIKGMVTSGGHTLDPSKVIFCLILGTLQVHEALGDMLTSIVSNSHFGKWPGARDMTIFRTHFIFSDMSLTMYLFIDEIFVSRAPGHLQARLLVF